MDPVTRDTPTVMSRVRGMLPVRTFRLPLIRTLEGLLPSFSPGERVVLYTLSALLAVSVFSLLAAINIETTSEVPAHEGSLTESIVGTPRFINPLLATSDPDRDMTQLVYSGLMRARPDNTFTPDLAYEYRVSEDALTYTFHLRDSARFHDGTPVTAHDIVFTVETAQNPLYKSTKRAEWEGVTVEAPDDYTVVFTLPKPYAPFLEATTLGILPRHIWETVSPEDFPFHYANTEPIGTGPYRITDTSRDQTGAPEKYDLVAFSDFTLGEPYITHLQIQLFATEKEALNALAHGTVESMGSVSPEDALSFLDEHTIMRTALPRVFGVFFNEGRSSVLADSAVRKAFSVAVDRTAIIDTALRGFGVPIDGPLPPHIFTTQQQRLFSETYTPEERLAEARELLENAGWHMDEETGVRKKGSTELAFSISTGDTPELTQTADLLAATGKAIGARITVKVFSGGDLNTTVIRPREYEALLFGEVVGRSADVYAFWHSSQRNDPGLNLSLYTNAKADTLVSDARRETDSEAREQTLAAFDEVIRKEYPAVFLYVPEFVYVTPKTLQGISLGSLTNTAERFLNVHEWYKGTERVWDIFLP